MKEFYRSSELSIKFSNKNKREQVSIFIDEYQRVMQCFVNSLWDLEKIPTFIGKIVETPLTWLYARTVQAASQQARGVVIAVHKKQQKRLYIINKLEAEGRLKDARKLRKIYETVKTQVPVLKSVSPELDSRFLSFSGGSQLEFDEWAIIKAYEKSDLVLPLKYTKHFNKLSESGIRTNGLRLSKTSVTFMFKIKPKKLENINNSNKIIGLDVGKTTLLTLSDGQSSLKNKHGHDLNSILLKMSKQKKGSKSFARSQDHRENYIGWSVNRINFSGITELRLEKLLNVKKGVNSSRILNSWTYGKIIERLESKCEELDVPVIFVNPKYTSQRCSSCGWVCKKNRRGKQFVCACGFAADADFNASLNISLRLPALAGKQQWKGANLKGFYWLPENEEILVPRTQKTFMDKLP